MVINRIHLGSLVFARTLAASIAARQSAPPPSGGYPGVKHGTPHATERAVQRNWRNHSKSNYMRNPPTAETT
jgi:hypothetical protein